MWVLILGWLGTLLILLSYFLLRCGKVEYNGRAFTTMNILGPSLVALSAASANLYNVVFLQIVFIMLTVVTIGKGNEET